MNRKENKTQCNTVITTTWKKDYELAVYVQYQTQAQRPRAIGKGGLKMHTATGLNM